MWVGVVGEAGVGAGVALWAGAGRRVGVWAGVAAFAWVDAEWCGGVASWRRGVVAEGPGDDEFLAHG